MQAKKQQLELDMEQQTGCISGQEYIKDIQVWSKSNPLWLYSGCDKQIQGIRSDRQSAWRTMDGSCAII